MVAGPHLHVQQLWAQAMINVLPFPLGANLHLFLFYYIDLCEINEGMGTIADK